MAKPVQEPPDLEIAMLMPIQVAGSVRRQVLGLIAASEPE